MSKKFTRKNQNRPPKPARPPKPTRTPLPEQQKGSQGYVTYTATPYEDTVMPVTLKFPPPLAELASDPRGFEYNWGLLTYAFGLDDPATAPPLSEELSPADLAACQRFVEVCRKVAAYTVVNSKGGVKITSTGGVTDFETISADDEVLVGFAVRFRQLHDGDSGDPTFTVIQGILMKAAKAATDPEAAERLEILKSWGSARGQLLKHPHKYLVGMKVLVEEENCPNPEEFVNYSTADPQKLISLFNYGDKIHHGKHAEEFAELSKDKFKHDHAEHEFLVCMLGLVHLYFGYSLLIQRLVGLRT